MDLSSKQISALERSGLEKGLNFAISGSKIPTAEIFAAAFEESISQLSADNRHSVRAEVSSINLLPKTFKMMIFRLLPPKWFNFIQYMCGNAYVMANAQEKKSWT